MSAAGNRRGGGKPDWRTPPEYIEWLMLYFPLAVDLSAKSYGDCVPGLVPVGDFFSDDDIGRWSIEDGHWGWCNPPYGRGLRKWVSRLCEISDRLPTVALLPLSLDTRWWADAMHFCPAIYVPTGRISFIDPAARKPVRGNAQGSMFAIFARHHAKEVHLLIGPNEPSSIARSLGSAAEEYVHPLQSYSVSKRRELMNPVRMKKLVEEFACEAMAAADEMESKGWI